jgi:hypothetical protein
MQKGWAPCGCNLDEFRLCWDRWGRNRTGALRFWRTRQAVWRSLAAFFCSDKLAHIHALRPD